MGVSFYVAFENSIKKPPFEIRHAIYLAFRPTGDYSLITQFTLHSTPCFSGSSQKHHDRYHEFLPRFCFCLTKDL